MASVRGVSGRFRQGETAGRCPDLAFAGQRDRGIGLIGHVDIQHRALAKAGIDRLTIHNLSKELELDDSVAGVYRKSLLYLVSRAFEENPRPAGILGMQLHNKPLQSVSDKLMFHYSEGRGSQHTQATSHGGFDNDVTTMNTVLREILRKKPAVPFTTQSLKY